MAQLELRNVVKEYGAFLAVKSISFTVADGEFVALVGPSGCGKTTTLNLIAGLLETTSGEIRIGDRQVNDLDPKDRDIAMVFQNYALYPNKTVYKNLGFPLRMRKLAKKEIDTKVRAAAQLLDITHLLQRHPRELSGGQQQRVALGRALVRDPQVFLMDEPLSNLDAKLRVQMRAELKRFHQDLKATIVYVTHDQLEAMTMADRIAVMEDGILQQYDTPERVFEEPANVFVAGFVGSPSMNLIDAKLDRAEAAFVVRSDGWSLPLNAINSRRAAKATGPDIVLGARHSTMSIHHEAAEDRVEGRVYSVEPTGDLTYAHVYLGKSMVVVSADPQMRIKADETVWIGFDQSRLHLFDAQTSLRLLPD